MSRWEPNARGRLVKAALELYSERGYERTTVAEIAKRAGLTERTYFRHFADKREVLFDASGGLQELFANTVAEAAESAAPIDAVAAGLDAVSALFDDDDRRAHSRRRQAVIAANAELRERELIKLAAMSAALADALRGRGVPEPGASLTAEAGIAVFKVGFQRWITDPEDRPMAQVMQESLHELRAVWGPVGRTRRPAGNGRESLTT
jgi:AcrR family transcriptional regulator